MTPVGERIASARSAGSGASGTPIGDEVETLTSAGNPTHSTADHTAEFAEGLVGRAENVGLAYAELRKHGIEASLAGNRISVSGVLSAQYLGDTVGSDGRLKPRWAFHRSAVRHQTAYFGDGGLPVTNASDGRDIETASERSRRVAGALAGRTVSVVGMGYVGIPTALSFTDESAQVIGFDVNEGRLSAIKDLRIDLLARDRPRLTRALTKQSLRLTTEPSSISESELIVVCVPTPVDSHMTPDLTALSSACETVVKYARAGQIVVLTSTTYAGCTEDFLVKPLSSRGFDVGKDIFVSFSPERIDPGVADHAPERTPRIVGGVTEACSVRTAQFLSHTAGSLHFVSSPRAAELTKLLENTFRAVNISMANEFAEAAGELGIDIMEVVAAAATKPYGFMPFYPGPGVGGHCIPCDPHYLLWQLRSRRRTSPVVEAAMTAIAGRPRVVAEHARRTLGDLGKPCSGARILVVGVTYKPGIADVRESPAIAIIEQLQEEGACVSYTDPYIDAVRTSHGEVLVHVPTPSATSWDLVLVHTVHPDVDHSWLSSQSTVLDSTYRLGLPHAKVP